MTGRVWLACMTGAALVAAAPAASAQAPAPPTKAQALTVAGDVAAGWGGALNAAGVDIEPCARSGAVRRCEVHVLRLRHRRRRSTATGGCACAC